jgi:RHS repeat-associated protein
MPTPSRKTLLCRYHYDPLDRLANCTPRAESDTQRFYNEDHLATEVQGAMHTCLFQHDNQLLAQHRSSVAKIKTSLLATDLQRSVLNVLDATQANSLAYSLYGHRPAENGLLSLLGFNGERPDPVTGHYLLGNGYRAFNPALMRFNSPDSWSPFGKGGLNSYGYCAGDPANRNDSSGHFSLPRLLGMSTWLKSLERTVATRKGAMLATETRMLFKEVKKSIGGSDEIIRFAIAANEKPDIYFLRSAKNYFDKAAKDSNALLGSPEFGTPEQLSWARNFLSRATPISQDMEFIGSTYLSQPRQPPPYVDRITQPIGLPPPYFDSSGAASNIRNAR